MFKKSARLIYLWLCMMSIMQASFAIPSNYSPFQRPQSFNSQPNKEMLVSIWMFYVGLGDPAPIQFSETLAGKNEPYDVLVNVGPNSTLSEALQLLYPTKTTVEHLVISHHDSDHKEGLAHFVNNNELPIEHVWHNGLASFVPKALGLSPQQLSGKQLTSRTNKILAQRRIQANMK